MLKHNHLQKHKKFFNLQAGRFQKRFEYMVYKPELYNFKINLMSIMFIKKTSCQLPRFMDSIEHGKYEFNNNIKFNVINLILYHLNYSLFYQ